MRNSRKKTLYRKREFLNSEEYHSFAALFGEIKVEWTSKKKSEESSPDIDYITFQISDCIRRIDLEFDTDTEKDWENSFNKIEKLETFISEFKKHITELYEMKKVKEQNEEDKIVNMLFEDFSNYFGINKVNDREINIFDIERESDYKVNLEIIDPNDIDLNDNSLNKFIQEKENEYDISIKIKIYE